MPATLKDLARYAEILARANDTTQGDHGSRAAAAGIAASMEREHPGIRETLARAMRALDPEPFVGAAPPPPPSGNWWKDTLQRAIHQAATNFAADLSAEATRVADDLAGDSTRRAEPLRRGQVKVKRHACAEGQVCVEVRARAADVRADADRIADAVAEALEQAADEVG